MQSVLLANLSQAKEQQQAEHIAFQLLDIYPNTDLIELPSNWLYRIMITPYLDHCHIVRITVQPNLGNSVTQDRWYCY
ncbi:type II secretion prepilin peptidase-dependent protein C [Orbus hercynius]|uniref:Type II secretion prepilin peptidase-dependent protein C n=1 Tax=Orbus hercynius TaxID=593135 RepID=A0A495RIH9_9GAMM|nr:prepilin-type N-terminal cleavage/methylation domain-containing protein [Orbus hercynius]RKS87074.1 type II secretion prepilin peptidase-dependent protein C [Orbus hercynius]